ncbi:MAG TPA: hypothetical protein VJK54_07450 [Chthoniobacterales bacterium]|nr:hypothetical protein [Chthoniobacterales bacterium]
MNYFFVVTLFLMTLLRGESAMSIPTPSPQNSPEAKKSSAVMLPAIQSSVQQNGQLNHADSKRPDHFTRGPSPKEIDSGWLSLSKDKNSSRPIDLPAPIGEEMKGVVIPQYDSSGRLTMNFYAASARKMNEVMVELHQLKVEFFEKDGKDVTVSIPQSIFNLETKILSTDTETTIQREDFHMIGQSGEFDIMKRLGVLKGHVHTEIRNAAPSEEL